jgi:hypothetical protein
MPLKEMAFRAARRPINTQELSINNKHQIFAALLLAGISGYTSFIERA